MCAIADMCQLLIFGAEGAGPLRRRRWPTAPKALAHCAEGAEGARCGAEGARWVGLLDLCSLLVGMVCGDCLLENFLKGAFGGAFGARPSASSWPLVSHCPCKFPRPGLPLTRVRAAVGVAHALPRWSDTELG